MREFGGIETLDYAKIVAAEEINDALRRGRSVTYAGQVLLRDTVLFGKRYFWMRDIDKTLYLIKETDGLPDFS